MSDSILALIVLIAIIICFSIQSIPMGVTAILGAIAMALMGFMDFRDVFSGFGNDTVMMVAGMIIVGNAFNETGLSAMAGNALMRIKFIHKIERLFLGLILIMVSVLHFFLTNTAIVAIFLPLIASVADASGGKITRKNTYMAVGITAVVSGNVTLISSTPQMAAQAILAQTDGVRTMGFFEMTKGAIPIVLMSVLYFCTFGYTIGKKVFNFEEVARGDTKKEGLKGNKIKMLISGVVFLGCIIGFVGNFLSPGVISIIAASILIITNCIPFKKAMQTMDWNALLVIAGALGFGVGLEKSGAIDFVAVKIMQLFGGEYASPYIVFGVLLVSASLLSTTMSNTATAAIMTPVAITIAQNMGFDPITFVIGIVFGCNYDFITPIGTPPLTMTLSGGYRFSDYAKVGGLFNAVAIIITILILPAIYGF